MAEKIAHKIEDAMWSRTAWLGFVIVALVLAAAASSRAQSATGTIAGQVADDLGGLLPGATIVLVHSATGAVRTLITDDRGSFHAPLLPAGVYELQSSLDRFDTHRITALQLTVGQTITLRIPLRLAGIAQDITVSGEQPVLERTRSTASTTVESTAIQHLPVNGRNFLDFTLLTPGVTRDVRPGDLSFAGQRGALNSVVVDGADNNNTFAGQSLGRTGSGRAPYQFSVDAVQEFQVNASGYSAAYGRAGGGVINVVTRSGTNRFAGSLFEFYRDKALNATNAINRRDGLPKSPYHYHQFGGTAGGPLRRNRDFFFFNYDGQRNTQPNDVSLGGTSNFPDDEAICAGLARLAALARSWTRNLDQDVVFLKTDHAASGAGRITIRYNHQDFTGVNFENAGPRQTIDHTGDSLVNTRTLNVSWARPFAALHNELRVQYAHDNAEGTANSDEPEAVIRQGGDIVLVIGRNNFSPRRTTINRLQIADTAIWQRGRHTLQAGFDLQFDSIDNFFPGFFGGQYVFQSLASFQRGRPDGPGELYRQNFPGPGTSGPYSRPSLQEYAAYVENEWRPAAGLTLRLGLRYDVMSTAAPPLRNDDPELAAAGIDTSRLESDLDNLAPRLGVVWSPDTRRFAVRGGWGVFYARTPAITSTPAHGTNGLTVQALTFSGSAVPTYPARFEAIPANAAAVQPNIVYVERGFENPRVTQAHAAFEQQVSRHARVTLTYLFAGGRDLTQVVDRNLGSEDARVFTIGTSGERVSYPRFGANRPLRNFARVIAITSAAESRYHGVTLDVHRRFADERLYGAAYTLGKATDTGPHHVATEDAGFPPSPRDPTQDRAPGNADQRHRFVAYGVYSTTHVAARMTGVARTVLDRWWVSAVLTAQAGQPYSARVGAGGGDLNNDGNMQNDLAPGTRRNQFRLPATMTLDTRLARTVRVAGRLDAQLIWEVFNVLNRTNIATVQPQYLDLTLPTLTLTPSPVFGRPTGAYDARIMQLAARLTF